uniref:AlbA family DNA-binding domain-containing protein n=1 Tax=Pseudomonas fulva TaxID=47880 RepID=UPI001F230C16|nr:ATP-binding protein [Pseudomonas fulva]
MSLSRQLHVGFSEFFAKPSNETLRALIRNNIGETNNVDFKEIWPDKGKLAKHVLALANSGGGVLLIGIKDDDPPSAVGIGPGDLRDKTVIADMIKALIPSSLTYEVFDFNYRDSEDSVLKGKAFQVLIVDSRPSDLPYLSVKSSGDLKSNVVYVRSGTSSTEASHDQLQKILDSRINTQEAARRLLDLGEHCEQLKMLFGQLPVRRESDWLFSRGIRNSLGVSASWQDKFAKLAEGIDRQPTYQDFISSCIEKKKRRIERELDI